MGITVGPGVLAVYLTHSGLYSPRRILADARLDARGQVPELHLRPDCGAPGASRWRTSGITFAMLLEATGIVSRPSPRGPRLCYRCTNVARDDVPSGVAAAAASWCAWVDYLFSLRAADCVPADARRGLWLLLTAERELLPERLGDDWQARAVARRVERQTRRLARWCPSLAREPRRDGSLWYFSPQLPAGTLGGGLDVAGGPRAVDLAFVGAAARVHARPGDWQTHYLLEGVPASVHPPRYGLTRLGVPPGAAPEDAWAVAPLRPRAPR